MFSFLRPNEIIIYESTRFNGRLFERKRMKGRFVTGAAARDDVVLALDMADFRRIGGRRDRAETVRRPRDSSNRQGSIFFPPTNLKFHSNAIMLLKTCKTLSKRN